MSLRDKYGEWALVTGASSGIGEQFARRLAKENINLVILARRFDRLQNLAADLTKKNNVEVLPLGIDLTDENFLDEIIKGIGNREVSILINNAGIGSTGLFLNADMNNEINMLKTNCLAPLKLTHHFAKQMADRKRGAIIFLGSLVGFRPTPMVASYSATKVFNIYLGASLWYELKKNGIDVLSLSPGGTRTEFRRLSTSKKWFDAEPEEVVDTAIKALGQKPSVVHGTINKILVIAGKLIPMSLSIKISATISDKLNRKSSK